MHIALSVHRYFPILGGSERLAQYLAEGLVRRGHRVTVVTQAEPGSISRDSLNGVEIRRIPVRRVAGFRLAPGYLRILSGLGAEIVHIHGNRVWCSETYLPFARFFRGAQILTGQGFYQYILHPGPFNRYYYHRYFPWACRALSAYVAVTRDEAHLLADWGLPVEKIERIPDGIPVSEFAEPPRDGGDPHARWGMKSPHVAVYAGGFFENKRVDRLVESIARTRSGWGLLVMGRDTPGAPFGAEACDRLAKSRGVEFRWAGEVPRGDLVAALFGAHAVVLGSSFEGFGLVLLEAMAAGRPFVSHPVGAAPELAATGGGFVVDDSTAFAAALDRLADPDLRDRMGRLGRTAVTDWTDERMVDRYLALYNRVGLREK